MSDPLELLLADGIIDEVLGRLKSGKEANVSLVRRGEQVLAAKVYKDRATRSFKSNSDYKEGRKVRNSRTQRSIDSGGRFGRDMAEQAWKSAEADVLYQLSGTGVRVPKPVMFYEGVLLMDLVLDGEGQPAPRLIDVALDGDEALRIYADLVAQMIAMLCCDLIHGDLSPYNILAAVDGPTIIDLPQVISAAHNSRAEFFFLRDFDNIVSFVAEFDPSLAVHTADGRAIWRAYVSRKLTPEFVPPPPRVARRPEQRSGQRPEQRSGQRPEQRSGQRADRRARQRTDDRARPPKRADERPGAPKRTDDRARPAQHLDGGPAARGGLSPASRPLPARNPPAASPGPARRRRRRPKRRG